MKVAYHKLAKLYHPDMHKNEETVYEAGQYFLLISEAYDILGNEDLRFQYDEAYRLNQREKMIIYDHPFASSRAHAAYQHLKDDLEDHEELINGANDIKGNSQRNHDQYNVQHDMAFRNEFGAPSRAARGGNKYVFKSE